MRTMPTMRKTWMLLLPAAFAITGCGIVYHAPVYQGNLLESKSVSQLKEGMSKQDVLALIGTPSVADPFHTQRWDYVETMQNRRIQGKPDVKTLTLVFNNDSLVSFTGSYFPDQDKELGMKMARFGNLPKDKKKKESSGGGSVTASTTGGNGG
jgi:outer membrane protein assembly factor BamE